VNTPQRFIKYNAVKGRHYRNPAVALIEQQLDFWFKRKKKLKFYKFIQPCEHYRHRDGDSWSAELGISADTFARCFRKIGIAYKSLSLYRQAVQNNTVFRGYAYASYYNRQTRQTFFLKNSHYQDKEQEIRTQSDQQAQSSPQPDAQDTHDGLHTDQASSTYDTPALELPTFPTTARADHFPDQDNGYCDDDIVEEIHNDYAIDNLHDDDVIIINNMHNDNAVDDRQHLRDQQYDDADLGILDLPTDNNFTAPNAKSRKPQNPDSSIRVLKGFRRKRSLSISLKEKEKESMMEDYNQGQHVGRQMIKIWQDRVGNPKLSYISAGLLDEMEQVLSYHFNGQLQQWQDYCKKIATSKFLMGEGKAFTFKGGVYLKWGLKPQNIFKIQQNRISTGDRQLSLTAQEFAMSQQCGEIIGSIQDIKRQQETLHVEVNRTRRWAVQDQVDNILQGKDPSQLDYHQHQFEAMIAAGDKDDTTWRYARCAQNFNPVTWRSMERTGGGTSNPWWNFEVYLSNLLATQHFGQDEPQMLKARQQQVEDQLQQLSQQLAELNKKRGLN